MAPLRNEERQCELDAVHAQAGSAMPLFEARKTGLLRDSEGEEDETLMGIDGLHMLYVEKCKPGPGEASVLGI